MKKTIYAFLGMALMLAIPFGASANDGTKGYRDAEKQVNQTAAETRQNMRDARQDMRDARQDMQDRKDDATMRSIESREDRQSTGEYLDDAAITAKVKAKFVGQKGLDSLDIKVVTVDGGVTLMGDVDSQSQIGLAESAARQVEGVRMVDNQLVIKK